MVYWWHAKIEGALGGKLVSGSHKRCELGHAVIRKFSRGDFSRGDQRIREDISVPDSIHWLYTVPLFIVTYQRLSSQTSQNIPFYKRYHYEKYSHILETAAIENDATNYGTINNL